MAEGNSVKDEKRAQRAKFKSMSRGQKINYLRTYYLAPAIIVMLLFIFVLWFLLETFVFHKDVLIAGCTINVRISDETYDELTEDLLGYLGGNPAKEVVNLSKDNYVDYDSDEPMEGYMDQTMLFTQIAAGEFSYMIIDKSALDNIYDSGYLADLGDLFGDDYLESKSLDLYVASIDNGDECPVGIYLEDTQFKCDAYLVFAAFVDKEMAEKILEYIIY